MRIKLGTQISVTHRAKLTRLQTTGLKISRLVEQGIDLVYDKFTQAGMLPIDPALSGGQTASFPSWEEPHAYQT